MATRVVIVYIDYKSPYAYLAKDPTWELEREFDVRLDWLPYTLEIPLYLGTVEGRNAHQWRRVRYSYMDARRLANRRGLTVRGPQKIFDSSIAHIGMLYAKRHDAFRRYTDLVFDLFWKRELEIENPEAIRAVLSEAGAPVAGFFVDNGYRGHFELSEPESLGFVFLGGQYTEYVFAGPAMSDVLAAYTWLTATMSAFARICANPVIIADSRV